MSILVPRALPGARGVSRRPATGRGATANAGVLLALVLLTAGLLGAAVHAAAPPAVLEYLSGSFGAGSRADYASNPARPFAPQRPVAPPSA